MAVSSSTRRAAGPRYGIKRVTRETLHDRVYLALRKAIMTGAIRPGESMTIRLLADELGTSSMPVREALRRLVAEGALEVLPNRSVTPPAMTAERYSEICSIRMALEGKLAESAAMRLGAKDLAQLEEIHRAMCGPRRLTLREYLVKNQEFHFIIYRAAGMPVTLPFVESLWLQIGPLLNHVANDIGVQNATEHHGAALAALRRRDGPAARAAIEADISDALRMIVHRIGDQQ